MLSVAKSEAETRVDFTKNTLWYTPVLHNILQKKALPVVCETVRTEGEKEILQKELDAMLFGNLEELENAIEEVDDKLGRYWSFEEVQESIDNGMPLSECTH
jgi:hypothetical protein